MPIVDFTKSTSTEKEKEATGLLIKAVGIKIAQRFKYIRTINPNDPSPSHTFVLKGTSRFLHMHHRFGDMIQFYYKFYSLKLDIDLLEKRTRVYFKYRYNPTGHKK